jgi:hypothetical protein
VVVGDTREVLKVVEVAPVLEPAVVVTLDDWAKSEWRRRTCVMVIMFQDLSP